MKKALLSQPRPSPDVSVCIPIACRQGELYFELHRGTYTSHAANKAFNRRCELLLREVEVAACLAMVANKDYAFPGPEVVAIWQVGGPCHAAPLISFIPFKGITLSVTHLIP